jgi:hypothetical protein
MKTIILVLFFLIIMTAPAASALAEEKAPDTAGVVVTDGGQDTPDIQQFRDPMLNATDDFITVFDIRMKVDW